MKKIIELAEKHLDMDDLMKRYDIELRKFASEPGGCCRQVAQICVDVPDDVNMIDFSVSVLKAFPFSDYADVYHKGRFYFRIS